jgi:hypothetical protein
MKTTLLLIISIVLLSLGTGALAQETDLPDPGMTPDSPFYFLERIAETIGTFFTFGDLKKAERHIALAAERLAETNAVAEKGKMELVEKALERYENQMVKAMTRIERAKTKGKSTEAVDNIIAEATQRHHTILERALEGAPEEAKPAIRHAMMASSKEGLEMMAATKDVSLRDFCTQMGGPSEMCEKIPSQGFESFESLKAFCQEAGGPPEVCSSLESTCREFGVTTPDECFIALSSTSVQSAPASTIERSEANRAGRGSEDFRGKCIELGGPPEICETMGSGQSYKDLENKCLQGGGPPDKCVLAETTCAQIGARSADECEFMTFKRFMEMAPEMEIKLKATIVPEAQ